jgi:hypothetical protein
VAREFGVNEGTLGNWVMLDRPVSPFAGPLRQRVSRGLRPG